MTGSVLQDIWKSAMYAASVGPSPERSIIYWILGFLSAMAYKLGAYFPLRRRSTHDASVMLTSTSSHNSNTSETPSSLFVVIPVFIRTSEELYELQLAINKLAKLPDVCTVVVDDASPINIDLEGCTVLRHPRNLGPAAARNIGIKRALALNAASIAFTDADCLPSPDWALQHARLQNSSPGIWAGRTLSHDNNLVSQFYNDIGTLMPRLKDVFGNEAIYAPTCNLSISANIARRISFDAGFPTSAFEDCDFCVRARYFGYVVRMSSAPVVRHRFKDGVFGLMRSYFKYGRSFPIMLAKHPSYKAMLESSSPMSIIAWRHMDATRDEFYFHPSK